MATSSIFADFSIRDKKTAKAFIEALEASAKNPRKRSDIPLQYVTDPNEIRKIFSKHIVKKD